VRVKGAPTQTSAYSASSDTPMVSDDQSGKEQEEYLISYLSGKGQNGSIIHITPAA
jgi:hypothetical protein